MTSLFRSRLEAEELQAALSGEAAPEVEQRHADLLRTVTLLREHEPVAPRPEFLADLRSRLMAAAEAELVPTTAPVRTLPADPRSPRRRRVATLAASLAIVGGSAGVAAATDAALPGDALYPIKRGGEQVVAAVVTGEAATGRAELRQARERLSEAEALVEAGAEPQVVVRALEEFRSTAETGAGRLLVAYQSEGEPDDVTAVRAFTAEQLPRLEELGGEPALEPVLLDAADALVALDQRARTLCAACGQAKALVTPAALVSAANAVSLDRLLARPAEQARVDSDLLAALDQDAIARLVESAEEVAGEVPRNPVPVVPPESQPATTTTRSPVETRLEPVDAPVRTVVNGTTEAVDELVDGLGRTVTEVTGRVRTGTPLDQPLSQVTDTVDEAVEGVTGLTGSVTCGLRRGLGS